MIREQNNYFFPLLLLLDLTFALSAYAISAPLSCFFRGCHLTEAQNLTVALPFAWAHYLTIAPLALVLPLVLLSITGGYRHTDHRTLPRILQHTGYAIVITACCLLSLQLLYPAVIDARFFLAVFLPLSWLGFILSRLLATQVIRRARDTSDLIQHVLIVGTDAAALTAANDLLRQCPWGIRIAGYLTTDASEVGRRIGSSRVLNTVDAFEAVLNHHVVDSVLLISGMTSTAAIRTLSMQCETLGIDFGFSASVFTRRAAAVTAEQIEGLAAVFLRSVARRPGKLFLKRLFDIVASLALIVLCVPFWISIPLCIRRTSTGPALFRQERVGKHGRLFTMYKFRTMIVGADRMVDELARLNEMDGPVFKISNDPRFTSIGRFLRTTSIDELPQLINVLKGDMSLVGPRPPIMREVLRYTPWQRKRLAVMPGITCLWQVTGRNEIKFDEWMQLDLQYIDNWSLSLDCKILIQTVTAVLSRRGAE